MERQLVVPKVSVIICGYNQGSFIRHAIESALAQTYPSVEVIVVDNGSTDDSQEIIKEFYGESRVTAILHAKNGHPTQRFNDAIRRSTGEFISLLYADDYYLPEKISKQMACFAEQGDDCGVVYSPGYRLNTSTGEKWVDASMSQSGWILPELMHFYYHGFVNPISPLMRRACFEQYPFREESFAEGELIFLRFALSYKFCFLPEPLVVMRDHPSNMGKAIKQNRDYFVFMLDRLAEEPSFPGNLSPTLRSFKARVLRSYGWTGLRMANDGAWARDCFIKSLRVRPQGVLHPKFALGMALSLLPRAALGAVNAFVNRLQSRRENGNFKESWV